MEWPDVDALDAEIIRVNHAFALTEAPDEGEHHGGVGPANGIECSPSVAALRPPQQEVREQCPEGLRGTRFSRVERDMFLRRLCESPTLKSAGSHAVVQHLKRSLSAPAHKFPALSASAQTSVASPVSNFATSPGSKSSSSSSSSALIVHSPNSSQRSRPLKAKKNMFDSTRSKDILSAKNQTGGVEQGPPKLPIEAPVAEVLEAILPIKSKAAAKRWSMAGVATKGVGVMGGLLAAHRKSHGTESSEMFTRAVEEQRSAGASQEKLVRMLLEEFRKRIMDKYSTAQDAFDSFDLDGDHSLAPREWTAAILRTGLGSAQESKDLFNAIDTHGTGKISSNEFHIAIESVTPVRSLEALRTRLLRCHPSTREGLLAMDSTFGHGEKALRDKRYTLAEFSACLTKVQVNDPQDQEILFRLLLNPFEPSGKVSPSEIVAALSVVSPVLLLEHLRDLFMRKFGSLEAGYVSLDLDKGGELDFDEFVRGVFKLGIARTDASRVFRLIDNDGTGKLSRGEIIGALRLSAPSLEMEDFRRKLRQRFSSIKTALEEETAYMQSDAGLTLAQVQEIFEPLDVSKRETQRLFELIDADGDKSLTVHEFMRGVRIFAPSTMLENFRMKIMDKFGEVPLAFKDIPAPGASMNSTQFQCWCAARGLGSVSEHEVQTIFDIVSAAGHESGVTANELLVALVAAQPGLMERLPTAERNHKVRGAIKQDLTPLHKSISEMKHQLRLGLPDVVEDRDKDKSKESGNGKDDLRAHAREMRGLRHRKKAETTFYLGGGEWKHSS